MNIIIIPERLSTTRSLTLGKLGIAGVVAGVLVGIMLVGMLLTWGAISFMARYPAVRDWVSPVMPTSIQAAAGSQASLNMMAERVGLMQAKLIRLEAMSERLAKNAGLNPKDFQMSSPPPQGGVEVDGRPFTPAELNALVNQLDVSLSQKTEGVDLLASVMAARAGDASRVPNDYPVDVRWYTSNFGWRVDPFTGHRAMHEGVDFAAPVGTEVHAAGSGVVISAHFHPEYGNVIDIDHGNGITTRYAHNSKLLVQPGDVVLKGQVIALSGDTGRSTGPHVHFEVRFRGVAENPAQFLAKAM